MKKMGTTLTIPFVRRRSAGIYTCVATNQFGGEVKASLQVSVYGKRESSQHCAELNKLI